MNVLQASAILDLQKRNVEVIQEQLRQTRDRFNVGEVTRTDVAQGRIACRRRAVADADSAGQSRRRRAPLIAVSIGLDPGRLNAGTPVDRLSPRKLDIAVAQGQVGESVRSPLLSTASTLRNCR